jgi:hypothetical protein
MKANVGSIDRMIRIVVGLGLLSVIFLVEGPYRWFGLIGFVPLLTATFRFCPLYTVVGIDTGGTDPKG